MRQDDIQALRLVYSIANFSVSTVVGILTYPVQIAAAVIVYRRLTVKEKEPIVV